VQRHPGETREPEQPSRPLRPGRRDRVDVGEFGQSGEIGQVRQVQVEQRRVDVQRTADREVRATGVEEVLGAGGPAGPRDDGPDGAQDVAAPVVRQDVVRRQAVVAQVVVARVVVAQTVVAEAVVAEAVRQDVVRECAGVGGEHVDGQDVAGRGPEGDLGGLGRRDPLQGQTAHHAEPVQVVGTVPAVRAGGVRGGAEAVAAVPRAQGGGGDPEAPRDGGHGEDRVGRSVRAALLLRGHGPIVGGCRRGCQRNSGSKPLRAAFTQTRPTVVAPLRRSVPHASGRR